jgi:hypothetical protein
VLQTLQSSHHSSCDLAFSFKDKRSRVEGNAHFAGSTEQKSQGQCGCLGQSNPNAFVTTHTYTVPGGIARPLVMHGGSRNRTLWPGEASVRLAARPHAWPTPEIIAADLFAWSHRRGRACAWTLALTPELFPMLLSVQLEWPLHRVLTCGPTHPLAPPSLTLHCTTNPTSSCRRNAMRSS